MKNILLPLLGFAVSIEAIAQPTLIATNSNPVVGDVFYGHDQGDTTGISNGASGSGVTWNLAFLDTAVTDTTLYLACAGTPYCDSFPGSTLAVSDGDSDYTYFITNATEFAVSGVGEPDTGFGGSGCVYYSVPQRFFNYPTTYGSVYADSFYSDEPLGQYYSYGTDSFIADAYGRLILPSGIYNNVLRVHLISYETDIFYLTSPTDTIYDTMPSRSETYFWFDTGFHNPLLVMNYDTSGPVTYLSDAEYYTKIPDPPIDTTTGIARIVDESEMQLYPNPANDEVHIKFNSPNAQSIAVSTIDILGRVVGQSGNINITAGINEVDYNVANFPPGVYLIKIQTEGNAYMEKVEIIR